MARISGLILGLSLLVVLSTLNSPASAWDADDDDDYRHRSRYRHVYGGPVIVPPVTRQPILIPQQPIDRFGYNYGQSQFDSPQGQYPNDPYNPYRIDYGGPQFSPVPEYPAQPQYQSHTQIPLAPPPLPPDNVFGGSPQNVISGPRFASTPPGVSTNANCHAGEFVDFQTALYPHVRVKGQKEIPRYAVPQIIAVQSPDPFRFPGLVYVQVYVPPVPPEKVKVEAGGAKIELEYDDFEVKIVSARGVVSVEYDD